MFTVQDSTPIPLSTRSSVQPSDTEIVKGIGDSLRRNRQPSTGDLKMVLAICAKELERRQTTRTKTVRLLESAAAVLGEAMRKFPRLAVPLVTNFVKEALADKSRRTPLAPQLAEVLWKHQRDSKEVDETGFACLRYIGARCLHQELSKLARVDKLGDHLLDKQSKSAALFLMRLATDEGGLFAGERPTATCYLEDCYEEHPDLVNSCALVILRDLGVKDVPLESGWARLRERIEPKSPQNSVSDGSQREWFQGKSVRTRMFLPDDRPGPLTAGMEVKVAIAGRKLEKLKSVLEAALSSDRLKREDWIVALRDNYPAFKKIMPELLDHFIKSCRFRCPHIALLSMFLAENPTDERLIAIAQEQVHPRQLRSPPLSGQDGYWKLVCNQAHDIRNNPNPEQIDAGLGNDIHGVDIVNIRNGWNLETIKRELSDFANGFNSCRMINLPILQGGKVQMVLVKDKKGKITGTLLNTHTANTHVCNSINGRLVELIRQLNDASRSGGITPCALVYQRHELDLSEWDNDLTRFVGDGRSESTIQMGKLGHQKRHSPVIGLELKAFMKSNDRSFQTSSELVLAFMREQASFTSGDRSERHKDRRVEAGVDWMLREYGG